MTTLVAGGMVLAIRAIFSKQSVLTLLDWVSGQGPLAPVLFVVAQVIFILDISTLGAETPRHTAWEWIAIAAGGVALVVTLLFVTRRAYSILNRSKPAVEIPSCG